MFKTFTFVPVHLLLAGVLAFALHGSAHGAVLVTVSGSTVSIGSSGGNLDESVQIYPLNGDSQSYRITGLNGTQLAESGVGDVDEVAINGVSHINVDLADGENSLSIYGIDAYELNVTTGDDDDFIRIWECHFWFSDVNINSGAGDDQIHFGEEIFNSNEFDGDVSLVTGVGADEVAFPGRQVVHGSLTVDTMTTAT